MVDNFATSFAKLASVIKAYDLERRLTRSMLVLMGCHACGVAGSKIMPAHKSDSTQFYHIRCLSKSRFQGAE
jgi:hypothetical protein